MRKITINLIGVVAALLLSLTASNRAFAAGWFDDMYPGFFDLQRPGTLSLLGFGGGFVSDKYGTLQEGVQAEQSVTKYIGVVGRVTGYQLWEGEGFDNPLNPGTGHEARLNFVRFQGGVDLNLYTGTHLFLLGGKDAADSNAATIEGDFSTWLFLHSLHPFNFSFSAIHNYQNDVTSSAIDLQAILLST